MANKSEIIVIFALVMKCALSFANGIAVEDTFEYEDSVQRAKLDILRKRSEHGYTEKWNKLKTDTFACSVDDRVTDVLEHHARHPRDVEASRSGNKEQNPENKAVYFIGQKQVLRLKDRNKAKTLIPYKAFTIELWIKPEGGQPDSVPIIELLDVCNGNNEGRGWAVGIQATEEHGERDPRIFFSLRTDRTKEATTIRAHQKYDVSRWTYVAALYTGTKMKLFINGGMVGVGTKQIGDLFSPIIQHCKEINLGGRASTHSYFRGYISRLQLWNRSLTHSEISRHARFPKAPRGADNGLVFYEEFKNLSRWTPQLTKALPVVSSGMSGGHHELRLTTPPCGKTVCDDPDVVLSYLNEPALRLEKVVRYRVINVMNDNGTNPTVSNAQIQFQHQALTEAFRPYNISWKLEVQNVSNNFLRERLILFGCDSANIGNGKCDKECQTPMTGNDGGDCDTVAMPCDPRAIGNGVCDYECDRAYHRWDGGDCCLPSPMAHQTCFDPTHPLRAYLSVEEYRDVLGFDSTEKLNVFFATWTVKQLIGLATFPWEKNLYTIQGGTIVQPENFGIPGSTDSLVHEFGHNLGLWHVHHGVSEMDCNDRCLETHPSLTLGDLCSDTVPTPHNTQCRDPDVSTTMCGIDHYRNTSFRNYMSYAYDDCTDHFTPQQVARMHCYLDLVYQPWMVSINPSPIPLKPKVVLKSEGSVSIAWLPPLGSSMVGDLSVCSSCLSDGSFAQYAHSATSRKQKGDRSPKEATGPPDADRCKGSTRLWLPNAHHCPHHCYLELTFQEIVVPKRLLIWATWNAKDGIDDVVLYLQDGSTHSLGVLPAFCDIPVTQDVNVTQALQKIRVFVSRPFVGIDAVQIISTPGHVTCDQCKPISYRLARSPPFRNSAEVATNENVYTDSEISRDVTYNYAVYSVAGGLIGPPSPMLSYTQGKPFCGDGKVNRALGETCDDANTLDGDGCDLNCQTEEFFHCSDEPSLCYIHDGDGVCEEFEKHYSVKDCGYYTPDGFIDQWASSAIANPAFRNKQCPERVITGPPPIGQGCTQTTDPRVTWTPCGSSLVEDEVWVKVFFARAVVATEVIVHFTSDGKTQVDPEPKTIQVALITDKGEQLPVGDPSTTLNCHSNPLHVTVQQDLSKQFQKTKGVIIRFSSYNIGISAVRLRSSNYLDLVALQSCSPDELYDVRSGRCFARACGSSSCKPTRIKNGRLMCSGHSEGDICTVQCNQGYRLLSPDLELRCLGGQWSGSAHVDCSPVDCGRPVISHASVACPDGTTYRRECVFKCKRPARRQGEITVVTCDADGLWSMPKSLCRVQCEAPPVHPNAVLASRSCRKGRHDVGKRCKFRCKKGYHVDGRARKRRVVKLTCEIDGDWSGLRCIADTCPPPDPIFTGLYQCSKDFRTGSQCYLSCPDDRYNQQRITCQADGQWDGTFSMCRFSNAATCPSLKNYGKGLVMKCNGINPGSTCEARCLYPHQHPVTNQRALDLTPRDTVLLITCTGTRRWFPDVEDIACVESCSTAFVGDGWCDAKNNRAQCLWDGGDCCSSTMEGRPVQPFPDTCTDECTCKDPDAVENYQYSETSNRSKSVAETNKRRHERRHHSKESN